MARSLNPRLCPFSSIPLAAFVRWRDLGPIPDTPPVIAVTDEEKVNMMQRAAKMKLPISKKYNPSPSYADDRWEMLRVLTEGA